MHSTRNMFAITFCLVLVMSAGRASAISYTNDASVYYPVDAHINVGVGGAVTVPDASGNGQDGVGDNPNDLPIAGLNGNSQPFLGGRDIYVAGEEPPSGTRWRNETLDLGTGDYTITMWVRATGAYSSGGGDDGQVFAPANFNVKLSQGGGIGFNSTDGASMTSSNGTAIPVDSEWYHVAIVVDRDGTDSRIYLNSSDVTDDPLEVTPTSLTPGSGEFWTWGRSLSGFGDDFAIFKQALSQNEISQLSGISLTTSTSTLTSTTSTSSTSTATSTSTTSSTTGAFGYEVASVYYPVEAYGGTQTDTVVDESGNGQDGIADGGLYPNTPSAGINGNSANFPGGADVYVAGEEPPSGTRFRNETFDLSTDDYTITMWVRATDSYSSGGGSDGQVFAPPNFNVKLSQGGSIVFNATDGASMASANGTAIPVDSEWHHVAVVVNRDNLGANPSAIYLDSVDVTDDPLEATPTSLTPGANEFWTWGRSLSGFGDDFAIFKQALSQNEISHLSGISLTTSTSTLTSTTSTSSTSTATSTTSTSSTSSTTGLFGYEDAYVWYAMEFLTNINTIENGTSTFLDSTANGQDGLGAPFSIPSPGLNGNSGNFGGGFDIYMAGEVPPSSSRFRNETLDLGTDDYTITMWVRSTGAYGGGGDDGQVLNANNRFSVLLDRGGEIAIDVPGDIATMTSANGSGISMDSEWYHVAVVVNRDNLGPNPSAIYLDSADVTGPDTMEDTPSSLTPGGSEFWTWGRSLNGQGDDFAIFKQALSQADIIELISATTSTSSTTTLTSTTSTSTDSSTTSTSSTSTTTTPLGGYEDACVFYPVDAHANIGVGGAVTVLDASGNGQDGVGDNPNDLPIAGLNGNSQPFLGGSDVYIAGEVPPSSSRFRNETLDLGTGDYTIMMWVRATDAYNSGGGNDGKHWSIHNAADETLFLSKAGTITYQVLTDGATMASTNGADIPVNSEWYHVAVVVNRDNLDDNPSAIYVNGVDATGFDTMEDTPTSLTPGAGEFWVWGRSLAGQGDDFAIFKSALSGNHIRRLAGFETQAPPMMLIIR